MVEQDYLIYEDFDNKIHIIPLEDIVKKVIGIYDETHIKAIEKAINDNIKQN